MAGSSRSTVRLQQKHLRERNLETSLAYHHSSDLLFVFSRVWDVGCRDKISLMSRIASEGIYAREGLQPPRRASNMPTANKLIVQWPK